MDRVSFTPQQSSCYDRPTYQTSSLAFGYYQQQVSIIFLPLYLV